ncbi:MAG TPA: methyltransferase, TIGR04325 family, partial [Planctomycetaceae bacterium]|nr:methyltransferase, TIGR04325 family [Planctomycetaceae bacterium]
MADWVPPHVRRLLNRSAGGGAVRYSGDFRTWEEARRHSLGYDTPAILERVAQSMLKVQRGEAVYERDSVLFDHVEHSFPLLTGLLRAALANSGRLNVVDIGGSLGSTYYQCRNVLEAPASVRWCVVEQPLFASCGRENFQSDELRFFENLENCLATERPDIAILSSVLPYVERPHALLETVARSVPRVIIDRTPLWSDLPDRLTVESVPDSIYGFATSYPAWILNRDGVLNHFVPRFRLVLEFDALAGTIAVDGTL